MRLFHKKTVFIYGDIRKGYPLFCKEGEIAYEECDTGKKGN